MQDDFAAVTRFSTSQFLARRRMVFAVAYLGYAACYLVRNNVAVVSEVLTHEMGWTPVEIGGILTGFTMSYGVGKLVMGVVVDRLRLRNTFAVGIGLSALICVAMAFMRDRTALTAALVAIGLLQGACAPAALAMLGAWYPPASRGSRVAIWNSSQNLGAAALPMIVSGGLALTGPNDWTIGFWLPGLIALVFAVFSYRFGGDRPWQESMPTLSEVFGRDALPQLNVPPEVSYWRLVWVHVIGNRTLAVLGLLNALLYLLRFGVLNWIPIFEVGQQGLTPYEASLTMSAFEWGAIPGALAFAWLAARWPTRNAACAAAAIGILAFAILAFALATDPSSAQALALLVGALVYGPQVIINILTLNFVSPRAIGVAVGWVALGGYLFGAAAANLTLPRVAEGSGWFLSFALLSVTCVVCVGICLWLRRKEAELSAAG